MRRKGRVIGESTALAFGTEGAGRAEQRPSEAPIDSSIGARELCLSCFPTRKDAAAVTR